MLHAYGRAQDVLQEPDVWGRSAEAQRDQDRGPGPSCTPGACLSRLLWSLPCSPGESVASGPGVTQVHALWSGVSGH